MFHHMKYVLEIYRMGSFTKAAESLFISQPALSATVKKLEKELGAPLFERGFSSIKPTEIGEKYIEAAEKIRHIELDLKNELDSLNGLKSGHISIGSSNYILIHIMPQLLSLFSKRYPYISVDLYEEKSITLFDMLNQDIFECIIDNFKLNANEYNITKLFEETIYLAVPLEFAINKRMGEYKILPSLLRNNMVHDTQLEEIDLCEFKNEPFILLKKGNDMRARSDAFFSDFGCSPNVCLEFDQFATAAQYTQMGFGVSFLTDTFMKYSKTDDNVFLYKFSHPKNKRNFYIAHRKNKYISCAMQAFLDCAIELLK